MIICLVTLVIAEVFAGVNGAALPNVSERFPQYEITAYLSCGIAKVYEYLNEKGR